MISSSSSSSSGMSYNSSTGIVLPPPEDTDYFIYWLNHPLESVSYLSILIISLTHDNNECTESIKYNNMGHHSLCSCITGSLCRYDRFTSPFLHHAMPPPTLSMASSVILLIHIMIEIYSLSPPLCTSSLTIINDKESVG
jgi:hypothetical protein